MCRAQNKALVMFKFLEENIFGDIGPFIGFTIVPKIRKLMKYFSAHTIERVV